MKLQNDLATMIGWNAEAFARTKRIKPMADYLKPPASPEQRREQGARDVRRMLERMAREQEGE